jgi:hypothetical protein
VDEEFGVLALAVALALGMLSVLVVLGPSLFDKDRPAAFVDLGVSGRS